MDKLVENFIESCRSCQASTKQKKYQPLIPTELPEGPWRQLAADFKSPIAGDYYFLLIIDEYSRFPEVAVVMSTGADDVIMHLQSQTKTMAHTLNTTSW